MPSYEARQRAEKNRTTGSPRTGTRCVWRRHFYMETYDATPFPPGPWHLTGTACVSAWRVPTHELPLAPNGLTYAAIGGTTLLLTIWANYEPGGTLAYNELAVAAMVRGHGMLAPAGTVTHIWVDDERSVAGGRELWAIPKQLGDFVIEPQADNRGFAASLSADSRTVASVTFEPNMNVPGRPCVSGFVIQRNDRGLLRTRCRGQGRLTTGRATWNFSPSGPLGFLEGKTPLFSLRMRDLQASFGI